jgi:hypothetical protein
MIVIESRHCEERSDEAIQGNRTTVGAVALDCFAASAARNDELLNSVSRMSGVIHA